MIKNSDRNQGDMLGVSPRAYPVPFTSPLCVPYVQGNLYDPAGQHVCPRHPDNSGLRKKGNLFYFRESKISFRLSSLIFPASIFSASSDASKLPSNASRDARLNARGNLSAMICSNSPLPR